MSAANPNALNQPLPDDLQSVLNELNRTDEEARQLVSGLSEAQLNWRSSPTAWSVAQCLDHLGQINSAYIPALQAAVRHADRNSVGTHEPIQPDWFGRWFINAMEPPPRRKFKSPAKGKPGLQKSGDEVLSVFIASHNELRSVIYEAREVNLNRIRFKNPFVSLLRFTVGTGI